MKRPVVPAREWGERMVRKLAGLTVTILVALLLAACGSDDDSDATEVAAVTDITTGATTEEATEPAPSEIATASVAAEIAADAAGSESSPVALPIGMASPAPAGPAPSIVGTPAASPVADTSSASPVAATPVGDAAVAPAPASGDAVAATPTAASVTLTGQVVLPGSANEAWVMTNEGCVGLGGFGALKPGQQLVVRDAEGAIVGVTRLAASDETDACSWDFSVTVPDSSFYAVSIPMVVERVFTRQEVEQSGGELVVPAT